MTSLTWSLKGTTLEVIDGHKSVVPTALQIYNSQFKGIQQLSEGVLPGPPSDYIEILFSRFPLDISLLIDRSNSGQLELVALLTSSGKVVGKLPDLNVLVSDHIVMETCWYPLANGSIESLKSLFNEHGLKGLGPVKIGDYLKLTNQAEIDVQVSDLVSKSFENGDFYSFQKPPKGLRANLYEYQLKGFSYLSLLYEESVGGILADEMGLGKTLQIIALILSKKSCSEAPCLVVAPATLLENWRREINKFAPEIQGYIHQGKNRTGNYRDLQSSDVVVTSYDTVLRDLPMLNMLEWDFIVLDEAQAIKNPEAKRTLYLKELNRRIGIAVTGTPVENSLTDLWSIMDFCLPGQLGSQEEFESRYGDDNESALMLEPAISPLILRRRVSEVAKDLPERIDITQYLPVSDQLAEAYEQVREIVAEEYEANSGLVSINKLRMLCTSSKLLKEYTSELSLDADYKLMRLYEILGEISTRKEKAIIFTSYTEMISNLVENISYRFDNVYVNYIDGRVPIAARQSLVDEFSSSDCFSVLVLNPQAAGTGLNITAANHVIHYNPEWNPALEDQSSARAYRRGQTRPVSVYKLLYTNTVEEIINERLNSKRELADAAIKGNEGVSDAEYIFKALQISPTRR